MIRLNTGPRLHDPTWSDRLFVRLFEASIIQIDPSWNSQAVRSSFWRLYVNWRSGAWIQAGGTRHPIEPGMAHLVPAWLTFSCHNTRTVEHLYLHFDLVGPPAPVIVRHFHQPLALALDPAMREVVAWLSEHLTTNRDPPPHASPDAKAFIQLALGRAFRRLDDRAVRQCLGSAPAQEAIAPALQLVEARLPLPITNAQLAQACHLSRDHFVRRFSELVGQTPAQYVRDRRIAVAAQRLILTTDSIDAIAQETGFANRFYFTRVFKSVMGLPPAAYRDAAHR